MMSPLRGLALAVLISLSALLAGCGSSSDEQAYVGLVPTAPTNNFFLGRVLLEDSVRDASVTITDMQDRLLYSLRTDTMGCFQGYGPLPADFHIRATRANDDMVYAREVRGGYDKLTMYVNPLTTIVSRSMAANGSSLTEAEDAVRSYFFLPAGYSLDWVTNSAASPFSPRAFHELALASGNLPRYYDTIAAQVDSEVTARMLVLAEEPSGSLAANFLKTVAGDILGDTVSVADAGLFGAITQALGLNLGTSGALNAISQQLDLVLQELTGLSNDIQADNTQDLYATYRGNINDQLADLENRNNEIVDVATGIGTTTVATLINDVQTLNISNDVSVILDYLLGQNSNGNIVFTYNQKLSNSIQVFDDSGYQATQSASTP